MRPPLKPSIKWRRAAYHARVRPDRYALAQFVANLALASQFNCLEAAGLSEATLAQMRAWAQEVSLDQLPPPTRCDLYSPRMCKA